MTKTQNQLCKAFSRIYLPLLLFGTSLGAEEAQKKKLKIVFLMGQSNMVGYAHPSTAWYLTQPLYVPPAKTAAVKSEGYNSGQFYWSGLSFARGDSEEFHARGKALMAERKEIIKLWRTRVYDNFSRAAKASGKTLEKNDWNTEEWGAAPVDEKGHFRSYMGKFLGDKLREKEVSKRMAEYIESPENKLHPRVAIKLLANRDEDIAEDLKRVREIFLKETKPEDFDSLDEAIKSFGKVTAENRMEYSKLVNEHINLPLPVRTHISALGAVAGQTFKDERQAMSQGPLSLGYSKFATNCGPEYPFGVSFEQMVDGPVLLVKCAWGGKSLQGEFRPPSLNTKEEPTGICWKLSMDHIQTVLADPGKYHPDYDPKAGVELSGLVWFQGWNDAGNQEYGKQLVAFIKDFRKEVKSPKLPVVCGLLGHSSWEQSTFDGEVNRGILEAAKHPDLVGTVDVVNTVKYYPIELGFKNAVKEAYGEDSPEYKKAAQVIGRATSKDPVHYYGSAKFWFLAGDAMARQLANLTKGGDPKIHQEAQAILKKN